jgi:undecaprenyl-diphosphatase
MTKNYSTLIRLAMLSGGLFALLAGSIWFGIPGPGDIELLHLALSWRTEPLTVVMQLLAFISSAVPAALICLAIALIELWRVRRFHLGTLWAVIALVGSTLCNIGLRILIGRLPPKVEYIGNLLPEIQASFHAYSFPSGHAGAVVVAYLSLVVLLWPVVRLRWLAVWLAVALILAVGLGRVYLGVHWPSDVIGGYLLALDWWAVGLLVRERYNR